MDSLAPVSVLVKDVRGKLMEEGDKMLDTALRRRDMTSKLGINSCYPKFKSHNISCTFLDPFRMFTFSC